MDAKLVSSSNADVVIDAVCANGIPKFTVLPRPSAWSCKTGWRSCFGNDDTEVDGGEWSVRCRNFSSRNKRTGLFGRQEPY